ncbi:cell division protein ZipA [Marinomonas rhizomae]|uniref:Cell division protein ZipA n=1 Tax=Marinomonas rhizomae TaxID=491948 RepID=A0A366J448_9GAMM|nr:cell division protein ZipA [Marinomonas rhizomae]RBP81813.1 cell division protein ZipA [Marinomonas rhizomae]RNF72933.1 cell division protein ZipA [Marinomonas rhizomae]
MEFSLREWLILIGVVIIVVILIDGFRRYKKGQEYVQADNDFTDLDELGDEVPIRQGSASGYGNHSSNERVKSSQDPIVNAFENARKTAKAPLTDVPHKVDSGPELDRGEEMHLDELASLVPERDFGDSAISEQNYSDDGFYEQDELDLDFGIDTENGYESHASESHTDEDYERNYSEIDIDQVTPNGIVDDLDEDEFEDNSVAEIEEVIVINIFAPEEKNFSGMELLQLILNCGMRYGEMDIFHRHEDGFDRGRVQFSMANAIEPGTFDLDTMGETDCPGVSFFMGLPGPKNSMKAFDFMLETAQALVRNLGGELRDERRSPMSDQTIAHCRQRIRDFERRRLMRNKQ